MTGVTPHARVPLPKKMRWRTALVCCAAVLAVFAITVAAIGLWVQSQNAPAKTAATTSGSAVGMLYAACVSDMIAKTCKVMGTQVADPSAPPPRPGEQVFIAGVGAIAATDYAEMYAAGDAMCSVVRDACQKDWSSARCQTARKLLLPAGV